MATTKGNKCRRNVGGAIMIMMALAGMGLIGSSIALAFDNEGNRHVLEFMGSGIGLLLACTWVKGKIPSGTSLNNSAVAKAQAFIEEMTGTNEEKKKATLTNLFPPSVSISPSVPNVVVEDSEDVEKGLSVTKIEPKIISAEVTLNEKN
jgi:hypothetical protein